MKHDDLRHDRRIEFETDDEENQAEGIGGNEDDYESGYTSSSGHSSSGEDPPFVPSYPWPQSYRQSMDMYTSVVTPPPSVSFLAGSSLGIGNSFLSSSLIKRHQTSEHESALSKPFIPTTKLDKEEQPPSARKGSSLRFSFCELPPTQQCSYRQAVLNGVNVLCGVGLLSTPYAVLEGGWASLLILLAFGIISCYTGILLKRCLESSAGLQTYPDIGQAAFGSTGRFAIAIILYIELYVCCVEYITLVSSNLSSVFPNARMKFPGVNLNSHYIFAITTAFLVLPTVWLRNLSLLSYLSAGGVVATILVVLCLLWVGVVDHIGFRPSGTVLDLVNLPVAFGIYGFCFSGHSVFPNIYSSMKEPSRFPSVLIVCFLICFLLYTGVAIFGFIMFGDATQSMFTLNLPQKFVVSKIAVWTTVVNPLCKYALTMTPVALSIEELCPPTQSHWVSVFIRTVLVFSTLFVALTVPFFAHVMALVGSLLTMLINLIFPCACYLSIHRGRVSRSEIVVCLCIILIAAVCSCIGTYSAIKGIVDQIG